MIFYPLCDCLPCWFVFWISGPQNVFFCWVYLSFEQKLYCVHLSYSCNAFFRLRLLPRAPTNGRLIERHACLLVPDLPNIDNSKLTILGYWPWELNFFPKRLGSSAKKTFRFCLWDKNFYRYTTVCSFNVVASQRHPANSARCVYEGIGS